MGGNFGVLWALTNDLDHGTKNDKLPKSDMGKPCFGYGCDIRDAPWWNFRLQREVANDLTHQGILGKSL